MSRVKRGLTAHARHKKILNMAKGYRGRNKNVFRVAVEKVEKGLQYAYRESVGIFYFNPLSFLSTSSSFAYLKTGSSSIISLSASLTFCCALLLI